MGQPDLETQLATAREIIELDAQVMKNGQEARARLMAMLQRAEGYIQSQPEIEAGWDAWIAKHPIEK